MNPSRIALAIAVASAALALSGAARADSLGDIMASNNEVGIASISQNINYSELDSLQSFGGPSLDSEQGSPGGYAFTVSVDKDLWSTNNYLALGYSSTSGTTNYTGGVMSGSGTYTPLSAISGARTSDYYARVGTTFIPGDHTMVTPYLEYGNHTWDRNVGQSTSFGYAETYTHDYAGAGMLLQFAPVDKLVLTADLFMGTMLNASISAASLGTQSMTDPNMLTRIGVGLDYRLWHDIHLTLGFDQVQYSYSGSAVSSTGFLEPPSNTTLQVTSIGLAYGF